MNIPTDIRWPTTTEWNIVTGVFGNSLPVRQRVFITDALGLGMRPFTIPTSALSLATIPGLISTALRSLLSVKGGAVGQALGAFLGIGTFPSRMLSITNAAYLINIGPVAYPNMSISPHDSLLVHEMTHVWQGKNQLFANNYVYNSALHQCQGVVASGSPAGASAAYLYTPGGPFSDYNAEQQAMIVQHWYEAGKPTIGPLWPYIKNDIRTAKGGSPL